MSLMHSHPAKAINPFSAARVRPGSMAFRLAEGESLEAIVVRLERSGRRGQIVGPHGSGKSTLLATLLAEMSRRGIVYARADLHDRQRKLRPAFWSAVRSPSTALAVVDGYEQLAHLARLRLRAYCRLTGTGLLVTAHRSVGLPTLYRTDPSVEQAALVVEGLLRGFPPLVAETDLQQCYHRYQPDIREMLFALYDLYESRRRTDRPSPA